MRRVFLAVAAALLLLPLTSAYGFSEKGQDCSKCHTLSKEEAATLLKDLIPNVKILDVVASPLKGTWEIDIEASGKKGAIYVDFSKKHLVSGSVIDIKEKKNLTQDRMTLINKIDVSKIPLGNALVMGEKDAKHKVIVFDDPE